MSDINLENAISRKRWTVATIILGFLAGGLPLWPTPYNSIDLSNPEFLGLWIVAGTIAGGFAAALSNLSMHRSAALLGAGFGMAVLARVLFETIQDPTTHNLWPFEVAIGVAVGLLAGVAGTLLVYLVRLIKK
jgi:H+/Cl- antiporter ClcA